MHYLAIGLLDRDVGRGTMLENHVASKGARDELDIIAIGVTRQKSERAIVESKHGHRREVNETRGAQEGAITAHAHDEGKLVNGNRQFIGGLWILY